MERIQWRDIKSLGKWKWAVDRLTVRSDSFSGSHPTASLVFRTAYRAAEFISRPAGLRSATE